MSKYLVPNKNQMFHRIFNLSKAEAPSLQVYLNSVWEWAVPHFPHLQCRFPWPCITTCKAHPKYYAFILCLSATHLRCEKQLLGGHWDTALLTSKGYTEIFDINQLCRGGNWGKDQCDPGAWSGCEPPSLLPVLSPGNKWPHWPVHPGKAVLSSAPGWAEHSEVPDTGSS